MGTLEASDSALRPATGAKPIRVLVVDDSAVVRQLLARELSRDPQIEVIGTAADAYIAREKILRLHPDVLTLDIEMPRMDGVTFLRKLMTHHPLRTVVLSSLAEPGAQAALDALACGAIEVLAKPHGDLPGGLALQMEHLIEVIKMAAQAKLPEIRSAGRLRRSGRKTTRRPAPATSQPSGSNRTGRKLPAAEEPAAPRPSGPCVLVAIGASTGGTEALRRVLSRLTADTPPVVAVIHMPDGFTQRFAERLNDLCTVEVREAVDGGRLRPGLVLLARGGQHMVVSRETNGLVVHLRSGPPVNRHRPSIDVLLHSVAAAAGANALGVILTGMGADGADGLLALHRGGAPTLVQDEATSIVFGMPRAAIERGAAGRILPLDSIGDAIVAWSRSRARGRDGAAAASEPLT
ncbi:MAG: protein-glutamate methylesterase/protein-glutamine glutaminase [Planctomycetota bacterium]